MKALLLAPLGVLVAILFFFPVADTASMAEQTWNRYNPVAGAWPSGQITYFNASGYDRSLREALQRWEDVGVPVRFRETTNREEADLLVFSDLAGLRERCDTCSGWATIGYSPFRQAEMWLLPPSHPFEERMIDFAMISTIIHEVGHVLGLRHNEELCSVMNTRDSSCRGLARSRISEEGRTMLCGPWERDLDNLREMYPETGSRFSGWCHDPLADWEFFVRHGGEVAVALEKFRRTSGASED